MLELNYLTPCLHVLESEARTTATYEWDRFREFAVETARVMRIVDAVQGILIDASFPTFLNSCLNTLSAFPYLTFIRQDKLLAHCEAV